MKEKLKLIRDLLVVSLVIFVCVFGSIGFIQLTRSKTECVEQKNVVDVQLGGRRADSYYVVFEDGTAKELYKPRPLPVKGRSLCTKYKTTYY